MNTIMMEDLYGKIANKVKEMIPEEWTKVFLYVEIFNGGNMAYFYYYPKTGVDPDCSVDPVYSLDISKKFNLDKNYMLNLECELVEFIQLLQDEFKKNQQPIWTNLTFILECTGKFNIDYNYDDLTNSDSYEQGVIWEYKYLGKTPSSDRYRDIKILQDYLDGLNK